VFVEKRLTRSSAAASLDGVRNNPNAVDVSGFGAAGFSADAGIVGLANASILNPAAFGGAAVEKREVDTGIDFVDVSFVSIDTSGSCAGQGLALPENPDVGTANADDAVGANAEP
jgi:hypothetical protein